MCSTEFANNKIYNTLYFIINSTQQIGSHKMFLLIFAKYLYLNIFCITFLDLGNPPNNTSDPVSEHLPFPNAPTIANFKLLTWYH